MSIMAIEIITRAELIEYAARAGVVGFSNAQWDDSIVNATDKIRQAVLNDYDGTTFESLSPSTAPAEMRGYAMAIALDLRTKADAGRPQSITDAATEAARWLGYVAGGKTHYDKVPNAVMVKRRGGAAHIAVNLPTMRLDYEDCRSAASRRDPSL